MKWGTAWWGMQFLAETKEDKKLLEKLINSLNIKADNPYEMGTYKIINPKDYQEDILSFSKEEIADAKMAIEFIR